MIKRFFSLSRHSQEYLTGKIPVNFAVLPEKLMQSLEKVLQGYRRDILIRDVQRLKLAFKSTSLDSKIKQSEQIEEDKIKLVVEYGERESMAYIASQMPYAYGPAFRVLQEIKQRIPSYSPMSLLDFGTGPGTAIWAANETFPSIESYLGVDISEPMLRLAERLLDDNLESKKEKRDLVISSFVFGDLQEERIKLLTLDNLIDHTNDFLIFIERGTPDGFKVLKEIRSFILSKNLPLHIFAPCPNDGECPISGGWCYFKQRLQLTHFQQEVLNYKTNNEDQKFSYLVVRKGIRSNDLQWPRIIRPPMKRSQHVIFTTCTKNSTMERIVASKSQGKDVYYDARKSKWGDLWPHPSKSVPQIVPTLIKKDYKE